MGGIVQGLVLFIIAVIVIGYSWYLLTHVFQFKNTNTKSRAKQSCNEVVSISVVANRTAQFLGPELFRVFEELNLKFGEMNIFHYFDPTQTIPNKAFSVVSCVEPGVFSLDNVDKYQTPGVTLFFKTDTVSDPLASFDRLIEVANRLKDRLHGRLLDASKKPLTPETLRNIQKQLTLFSSRSKQ